MEPFDRSEPTRKPHFSESSAPGSRIGREKSRAKIRTPFAHQVCDRLTEAIIYFMVIFTPWAFGTTQSWAIWTMNIAGYLLAGLLAAKWVIRWQSGYQPSRWGVESAPLEIRLEEWSEKIPSLLTVGLGVLTFLILAYCLVSAVNCRATYWPDQQRFEYHDYIPWLPHSYDSLGTWRVFWSGLGLASFFWAARDWLLGITHGDRRAPSAENRTDASEFGPSATGLHSPESLPLQSSAAASLAAASSLPRQMPTRLRRLLWVVCLNGALLALEGILQRLDGTNKLLWLITPRFNQDVESQFGPYAYRSNAASYLNLVWPVCLGFWMVLRKSVSRRHRTGARVGGGSHVLLLPCAVVMAAAPVFTMSRGGAAVSLLNIILASAVLFFATRGEKAFIRAGVLSLFLFILGFSAYLGWQQFQERLENIFVDNLSDRPQIYINARPIADDFPVFGTGPGTFGPIYRLYKQPQQVWAAYLHDDFLETRLTFGWVGFSVLLLMLGIALARWFFPHGIPSAWEFVAFAWLALGGCLFHAKFDFPFQIYSVQFLFLLVCSILFCVSRK
jgi:hypothetical protein